MINFEEKIIGLGKEMTGFGNAGLIVVWGKYDMLGKYQNKLG